MPLYFAPRRVFGGGVTNTNVVKARVQHDADAFSVTRVKSWHRSCL